MGANNSLLKRFNQRAKSVLNKRKASNQSTTQAQDIAHPRSQAPTQTTTTTQQPQSQSYSPQEQAVHETQLAFRAEQIAASPPPVTESGIRVERTLQKEEENTSSSTPVPPIAPVDRGSKDNKMASDGDYANFLDKANQDPSAGTVKGQSAGGKVEFKAVEKGVKIPDVLRKATKDAFYVSDADEGFEPVGLILEGSGLPDESSFAKLINHPKPKQADVSILDISEWDPQGQYKELVDAVREAVEGSDVRVFRIAKDGTRVEYWVVGVTDGKLLGAKALAVES